MKNKNYFKVIAVFCMVITVSMALKGQTNTYSIVGTNQSNSYDTLGIIATPSSGQPYYGQNSNHQGNVPSYTSNGDGTVTDNVTGLMWQQTMDRNGDGTINFYDKLTWYEAKDSAATCNTGGYHDWRLPSITELYSLALFSGAEVNPQAPNPGSALPYIDTTYFGFGYGDINSSSHGALANERIIDAQNASSTLYVSTTMGGNETMFGFNFADGRIKGYPTTAPVPENGTTKHYYILYVRGNTAYGTNQFADNGDGTVTDNATGLMWMKNDNGTGLSWPDALSYAENFTYAGHSDWRLPDTKEMESIIDYTRSPATTGSAAINPVFNCTQITNEGGVTDYPWYWSNTTFCSGSPSNGRSACYLCFGRALGYMQVMGGWQDVHGAGAQRSDPKSGSLSFFTFNGNGYYNSQAPQGDAVRLYNYVRLVRNITTTGLNEKTGNDKMNIYPNPSREMITINLPVDMPSGSLVIFNQYGAAVYKENISSGNELKIAVSGFPKGLYFVRISGGSNVYNGKFIVQ